MIDAEGLPADTSVWTEGMGDWAELHTVAAEYGLRGVSAAKSAGGVGERTLSYDLDGEGTPSDPVTMAEVESLLAEGLLTGETMVWSEGVGAGRRLPLGHVQLLFCSPVFNSHDASWP